MNKVFTNERHPETNRKSVLKLIDFYSSWSVPCENQSAILDDLKEVFNDRIEIIKTDIDDPESDRGEYRIKAVPTLCLLKKGREVRRFIGVQPLDSLVRAISTFME